MGFISKDFNSGNRISDITACFDYLKPLHQYQQISVYYYYYYYY